MIRLLQEFPCYNCICVPVCRHKSFHSLYHDCSLISHLFNEDYKDIYLDLQTVLKPTLWKVDTIDKFRVESNDGEYDYG